MIKTLYYALTTALMVAWDAFKIALFRFPSLQGYKLKEVEWDVQLKMIVKVHQIEPDQMI